MKKLCLQFRDILELIEFTAYLPNDDYLLNTETQTLDCTLTEAQLELAVNAFSAIVVG